MLACSSQRLALDMAGQWRTWARRPPGSPDAQPSASALILFPAPVLLFSSLAWNDVWNWTGCFPVPTRDGRQGSQFPQVHPLCDTDL